MLALALSRENTCQCGGWLPETTVKGAEYDAVGPIICNRCEAVGLVRQMKAEQRAAAKFKPIYNDSRWRVTLKR